MPEYLVKVRQKTIFPQDCIESLFRIPAHLLKSPRPRGSAPMSTATAANLMGITGIARRRVMDGALDEAVARKARTPPLPRSRHWQRI